MPVTICTWNINSVRLREPIVLKLLKEEAPDVLCLQETKSPVEKIPTDGFAALGYNVMIARGDKGYNGVAILSRVPMEEVAPQNFGGKGDARHVAGRLASGVEIHNVYLPAGGDVPDPAVNEKFDHKLRFVADVQAWGASQTGSAILVGDLNIAPREDDVWSHKQLLKIVSHTPVETESLEKARKKGGFTDTARHVHDEDQRLYSWWSYRARDWAASNKGRRLVHIWTSDAATALTNMDSYRVHLAWRGGWKPSDHAPISIEMARP